MVVNTKVGEFADDEKVPSPFEEEEVEDNDEDPIQHLVRQSLGGSTPVKNTNHLEMQSWIDDQNISKRKYRNSISNSLLDAVKSNNLDSTFEALSNEKNDKADKSEEPNLKKKRFSGFKDSLLSSLK